MLWCILPQFKKFLKYTRHSSRKPWCKWAIAETDKENTARDIPCLMKLLKSLAPVQILLNPVLQHPSALSAEHRLGGKELGPLSNRTSSDGLTSLTFGFLICRAVVTTHVKLSALAWHTVKVQDRQAPLSLCWILPAHHIGIGNDSFYLQLLSQPEPGPPTLSHQSTSDSRALH